MNYDREVVNDFFRKEGIIIGNNIKINCNILSAESYPIEIGNNVTIAHDVQFIIADNAISKVMLDKTDLFGKIIVGNNSFIGARVTILYGVKLSDNIVVASGSVVTKSFDGEKIIIVGSPARKIGTWEKYADKHINKAINIKGLTKKEKRELLRKNNNLVNR